MLDNGITQERIQIIVETLIKNRNEIQKFKNDFQGIKASLNDLRNSSNLDFLPRRINNSELLRAIDESEKIMRRNNIGKIFDEQAKRTGKSTYDIKKALSYMSISFDQNGKPVDFLGRKIENLNQVVDEGIKKTHRFNFNMLGVMFAGMALQRTVNGLVKTSMEWMGVQELLNETLGVIFLPIADEVLNALLPIMEWFMDLPDETKKAIGEITLFIGGIGTILATAGSISLGAKSLGNLIGVDITSGIKSKLKEFDFTNLLKIGATLFLAKEAYDDFKSGKALASLGDALAAGGMWVISKNPPAGAAMIGVGVALKLLGDSEFLGKVAVTLSKVMDYAVLIGESIHNALTGNFDKINFKAIMNPLDTIGLSMEKAFINGEYQSNLFNEAFKNTFKTSEKFMEETNKVRDNIKNGIIPKEEINKTWDELYNKYSYYIDYINKNSPNQVIVKKGGDLGFYDVTVNEDKLKEYLKLLTNIKDNASTMSTSQLQSEFKKLNESFPGMEEFLTLKGNFSSLNAQGSADVERLAENVTKNFTDMEINSNATIDNVLEHLSKLDTTVTTVHKIITEEEEKNNKTLSTYNTPKFSSLAPFGILDLLTKKVKDAVITPTGRIISTDPRDYLIATKNPSTINEQRSQNITISPVYNITGVSSPADVRRMIEENNRNLTAEIRRIVQV